jgi:acyl carrier protein
VQRGARHVVLMARTELPARASWRDLPDGPRARAAAAVREIESLGASVLPAAVDIADPGALSAWLDGFRAEGRPPIRGVVHLAGVLAHRALHEETAEGLEAALRPKVLGALSLHRLLQGEDLDFFVLFSSAAAVLSSPLLGAYAAGNAFLDALAHYRRGHGLPALSVNWGLWGETGMATRFQGEDVSVLAQRGMGAIRTAEGVEALWRLIGTDVAHAAVLPVDWTEWARRYPAFAEAPFLSKVVAGATLREEDGARAGENRGATREAILAVPSEERVGLVKAFVIEQVAQVMRVATGDLDDQQPLRTLGLDSLMAVEIRNRIEAGLGVAIPLVSLLEGPSIVAVAEHVGAHLSEPRALTNSAPDVGDAVRAAHLLERLDDLSDAEVHALLEQMLPGRDVA